MRAGPALLTAAVLFAAAGCGIDTTGTIESGQPATGIQKPGKEEYLARIFFSGGSDATSDVTRRTAQPLDPQQALDLLQEGPDKAERDRGLISRLPETTDGKLIATWSEKQIDIEMSHIVAKLDSVAVSQIACTAAHAEILGGPAPEEVDVYLHEVIGGGSLFHVRCEEGTAVPQG